MTLNKWVDPIVQTNLNYYIYVWINDFVILTFVLNNKAWLELKFNSKNIYISNIWIFYKLY